MALENHTFAASSRKISVIIPTYNRADILRKTLRAYSEQDAHARIREVLVVDDGSKDHTRSVVEEEMGNSRVPLCYLRQQNSGLAAARNHAIREARGELLLFGDDDIIPDRSMVAEHLAWHQKYPEPSVGVLGHVDWAQEVNPTPFMKWAGLYGPQFQFGRFQPGIELDFRNAYFCNTSLKSEILKNIQGVWFDEQFRSYGWEDIEFSYRLYQRGWRLRYHPDALGYHYKFETFDQTLRRVEQVWQKSWLVYSKTESGRRFVELQESQNMGLPIKRSGPLSDSIKQSKRAVARILRPLMDSKLTLPDRLYDFVWYHHCKPIMDAAFAVRESVSPPAETVQQRLNV
jgi:GT2 family glycosyltransferase